MPGSTIRNLALAVVSLSAAPAFAQIPAIPPEFDVTGHTTILIAHAEGAQVYQCKANAAGAMAWAFREPIATLIGDGKTVGRHYGGPNWELTDSSRVKGKVAANIPGGTPKDIAQLKLDVIEHGGDGMLKDATMVLRINTHGGAIEGACPEVDAYRSVPYSADYVFLR
jgi:hypothetical protein